MDDKTKIPPPVAAATTLEGLVTHFSYMRRDMDEIKIIQKTNHEELKIELKVLSNNYVSRVDFDDHLRIDQDHENRIRTLEKGMWKWVGICTGFSTAISIGAQFLIK